MKDFIYILIGSIIIGLIFMFILSKLLPGVSKIDNMNSTPIACLESLDHSLESLQMEISDKAIEYQKQGKELICGDIIYDPYTDCLYTNCN
jgi:hypothetical protein